METYTPEELKSVLDSHAKWLRGEAGGGRANLSYANLSYANLRNADLRNANLSYANLSYADLSYANLSYADLSYANLSYADLRNANLRNADLRNANLSYANLSYADLRNANLSYANLSYANGEDLAALLRVPSLHRKMLAAIEAGGELDMSSWHSCETTHCRSGWSIRLAGPAGKMLEWMIGPSAAGALIHVLNCPALEGRVPDFHCSDEEALADIRRLAALEPELVQTGESEG